LQFSIVQTANYVGYCYLLGLLDSVFIPHYLSLTHSHHLFTPL